MRTLQFCFIKATKTVRYIDGVNEAEVQGLSVVEDALKAGEVYVTKIGNTYSSCNTAVGD